MKHSFFQAEVVSILLYRCTTWTLTKRWRKSLMATTQECYEQYWTSPGGNTPQSTSCTATYLPSRKFSKLMKHTCMTLLEKQGRAHNWYSPMDLLIWPSKSRTTSANLHRAAPWGYGVYQTYQKRWTMGRSGVRGSGISVQVAGYDDDDDDCEQVVTIYLRVQWAKRQCFKFDTSYHY